MKDSVESSHEYIVTIFFRPRGPKSRQPKNKTSWPAATSQKPEREQQTKHKENNTTPYVAKLDISCPQFFRLTVSQSTFIMFQASLEHRQGAHSRWWTHSERRSYLHAKRLCLLWSQEWFDGTNHWIGREERLWLHDYRSQRGANNNDVCALFTNDSLGNIVRTYFKYLHFTG